MALRRLAAASAVRAVAALRGADRAPAPPIAAVLRPSHLRPLSSAPEAASTAPPPPREGEEGRSDAPPSAAADAPPGAAAEALAAQAAAAAKAAADAAAAAAARLRSQLGGGFGGGGGGGDGGGPSSSTTPSTPSRLATAWESVKREVAAAVLPEPPARSATRAAGEGERPEPAPGGGPSALATVPEPPKSAFRKGWDRLASALGANPVAERAAAAATALGASAPAARARELREELLDRWETSDSPFVHRLQGMSDAVFAETDMAKALREARARDPGFDVAAFLAGVSADVPAVLAAYLTADAAALAAHCSPDLVERVVRVHAASEATPDPTVLDCGDVELVDLKFLDGAPAAVVQFSAQQIACARDAHGNVVDGAPDAVHRVYYYWALVQDDTGFVGAGGEFVAPRWQVREMLVRGAHQLL